MTEVKLTQASAPGFSSLSSSPSSIHQTSTAFLLCWCSSDSEDSELLSKEHLVLLPGAPGRTDQTSQFSEGESRQPGELSVPAWRSALTWELRASELQAPFGEQDWNSQLPSVYQNSEAWNNIYGKWPDSWVICGFLCIQWTWIKPDAMFSTWSHSTKECIWLKYALRDVLANNLPPPCVKPCSMRKLPSTLFTTDPS